MYFREWLQQADSLRHHWDDGATHFDGAAAFQSTQGGLMVSTGDPKFPKPYHKFCSCVKKWWWSDSYWASQRLCQGSQSGRTTGKPFKSQLEFINWTYLHFRNFLKSRVLDFSGKLRALGYAHSDEVTSVNAYKWKKWRTTRVVSHRENIFNW